MGTPTGVTPLTVSATHGNWRSSSLWTLTSSETRNWVLGLEWGPIRWVTVYVCCCGTDCIMGEHCSSVGSQINSEALYYPWTCIWDSSQNDRNTQVFVWMALRMRFEGTHSECCIMFAPAFRSNWTKGQDWCRFVCLKVHLYSLWVYFSTPWPRCGFRRHQRWTPVSSITAAHSWVICSTSGTWCWGECKRQYIQILVTLAVKALHLPSPRFDFANSNINDENLNKMNPHHIPDVVSPNFIVLEVYSEYNCVTLWFSS